MIEFKVGDWVKGSNGTVHRILAYQDRSVVITNDDDYYHKKNFDNLYELWQPQVGEWCWFRDTLCKVTHYKERPYITYLDDSHYVENDDLEPFIGTLPSFIEDSE